MKQIKLGILGYGQFSGSFVPLFQAHPGVREVVVAELDLERRDAAQKEHQLKEVYANETELFASDVDAVAIFTPRHDHVRHSLAALKAGKHVYCAVPAANTLEELHELIEAVKKTGQIYMMGETSHYYPQTVFCRKKYQAGEFGRIVYGEGEYYHPMEGSGGFYPNFRS